MRRILVVEDDPYQARAIAAAVGEFADIDIAGTLKEFVKRYGNGAPKPDLAIVDLGLPDGSFLSLSRDPKWVDELRQWPIIFVSLCDEVEVIERLLDGDKRDYITKPCNLNLLVAKCRQLLASPFELCVSSMRVRRDDLMSQPLTALEGRAFAALRQAGDTGLERRRLGHSVWGSDRNCNKISVLLCRLRKKLEPIGVNIDSRSNGMVRLSLNAIPKS